MSVEACSCTDYTLGNFGQPVCTPVPGVTEKLIFAPYFNSAGDVQHILLSDTLDATYFAGHNKYDSAGAAVNVKDRWYITDIVENYESERGETKFHEWASGRREAVTKGVRSVKVTFPRASFLLLSELVKTGCIQVGVLKLSHQGIVGNGVTEPTKLRFLKIDKASWDAMLMETSNETSQHITLSFQFAPSESDANLRMISIDDISADLMGLLPDYLIEATQVGTMTTTTQVVDIFHYYGSAKTPEPIPGLITANFKYRNTTDAADVTPSGVVESTTVQGRYTLTFAAQTAADKMHLRVIEPGIDDTNVYADEYTIGV